MFCPKPPEKIIPTGTNGKTSVLDYTRQIWNRLRYVCATIGTLGIIANLDTFCMPEYYCDGLTTLDRLVVEQILHCLAFKEITHVAIEASSHALHQNCLENLEANCIGFTSLSRDHLDYHNYASIFEC